jgi:hypothetical protein
MVTKRSGLSVSMLVCLAANAPLWAEEQSIALSDVPSAAIAAAEAAVPGLRISAAEVEDEHGQTVYELEGSANGVEYEVEVTVDGRVLEVESDD